MGNFKRSGKGKGGGKFHKGGFGKPSFGGGHFGKPQMFGTTCDGCGNSCEVPFRPSGDKPVYCNDCFRSSGGTKKTKRAERDFGARESGTRDSGMPNYGKDIEQLKRQFEMLNVKVDKILKILTLLTSAIPAEDGQPETAEPKAKLSKRKKTVKAETEAE